MTKYAHLDKAELLRLLECRDAERQLGLVWERDELEADRAIDNDYVALGNGGRDNFGDGDGTSMRKLFGRALLLASPLSLFAVPAVLAQGYETVDLCKVLNSPDAYADMRISVRGSVYIGMESTNVSKKVSGTILGERSHSAGRARQVRGVGGNGLLNERERRMSRTFTVAVVLAMLLGSGAAHASLETVNARPQAPMAEVREAKLKMAQAFRDLRNGDVKKGAVELDALVAAPGFFELPSELRFTALYVASVEALQRSQYAKAHKFAVDATALDEATGEAWLTRLASALFISDFPDAGRSVCAITKRWPAVLEDVDPRGVVQIHHALRTGHEADIDRAMLEALFDADWQSGVNTYDYLWRDLALMQIERGDNEQAARIARRIGSASTVLSMRVDKRFDPITQGHPQDFDVDRLLDAQIQAARARVKAHPGQLDPVNRLQDLLLEKGRYAEVLAVSDAAVTHAEHGDGGKAYTDFAGHYNWVLNQRSLAFAHEGRWGEAAREMERAAKHPESGGLNVSQSINLAGIYTDMDEPDKASAAIIEPGPMSPYGAMQLHYVRLQIAIEKNNAHGVAEHMAYLKKHRKDDIATWQRALLRHGDLDAAAAVLIKRLKSPDWRNGALVEMQLYMQGAQTPTMKLIDDRWKTITSRTDVLKALADVGRVEHFNVTAPAY